MVRWRSSSKPMKPTLKLAFERIKALENAVADCMIDNVALTETVLFVAEKSKLKESEILEFYMKKKAFKKDAFLRHVEDVNPALAAENDTRPLDQIPTDEDE